MQTIADRTPTLSRRPVPRRRLAHAVLAVLGAAAVAAGGAYLWLSATSDPRVTGTSCAEVTITGPPDAATDTTRRGVCSTLDRLVAAWNAGDAAAYGAEFTEHAMYVAFTGTVYRGPDDIAGGHAALFDGLLKGSKLSGGRVLGVDVVAPGVAQVVARGDTYTGDTPPSSPAKVQSYTMVEQADGTWKVAAFHNVARSPVMERVQFLMNPASRPAAER